MSTVTDSFNRPDNLLTLGTADSGQLWVPKLGSVWGISANQAYTPVTGTPVGAQPVIPAAAVIDSGMHNIIVQATVTSYGNTDIFGRRSGGPRIIGYWVDELNYLVLLFRTDFQIWTYYEITGGFQTDVHFFNFEADPIADGDVMKMVFCEGPPFTVECWQNSTQLLGANLTHPTPFLTATIGGLGSQDNSARFDNFSIIQNPACADNTAAWSIPAMEWTGTATNAGPQPPPTIVTCPENEAPEQPFPRVQRVVDFRQEIHRNLQWQISTHAPLTLYGYSMDWVQVSVSELTEQRNAYAAAWQFTEYGHLFYAEIAHISTADLTLQITVDNGIPDSYVLPSSGGLFVKRWVVLGARKGKLFDLKISCASEFQIIPSQSVLFGKEFNGPSYQKLLCFGDQT